MRNCGKQKPKTYTQTTCCQSRFHVTTQTKNKTKIFGNAYFLKIGVFFLVVYSLGKTVATNRATKNQQTKKKEKKRKKIYQDGQGQQRYAVTNCQTLKQKMLQFEG